MAPCPYPSQGVPVEGIRVTWLGYPTPPPSHQRASGQDVLHYSPLPYGPVKIAFPCPSWSVKIKGATNKNSPKNTTSKQLCDTFPAFYLTSRYPLPTLPLTAIPSKHKLTIKEIFYCVGFTETLPPLKVARYLSTTMTIFLSNISKTFCLERK